MFASDADGSLNQVSYSLTGIGSELFSIDAGGVIRLAAAVDFEIQSNYSLTVRASSQDGSIAENTFAISIVDQDEFDVSAPVDSDLAANAVTENAIANTPVGIVVFASDADGSNNAVIYTLDDNAGGRFQIDAVTGLVTVAGPIDYEAAQELTIVVRATSQDGSSQTATFVIQVINESEGNDCRNRRHQR